MPQILEFACPHCQARLRSRDRTLIGREMPCPECKAPLRISDTADGRIIASAVDQPAPSRVSRGSNRWPVRAAVATTILLCVGLLVFVLRENPGRQPADIVNSDDQAKPAAVAPPMPADDVPAEADPEAVQRMKQLGQWLTTARTADGAWPLPTEGAETVSTDDRLSWLARLAQQHVADGTPPPTLTVPWNAPENDRFVRRRLAPFQIPGLESAGTDGYPAGHFVGVAGVGPDAAELPKAHPQAGIFGWERRTTLVDVKDGLANTILVLGRESRLHSWADGRHSIRGLTAEPYLRGPDGFGTGQPDGMFALLADGSVKFLSVETAPVIFRRYAAMADGQPLDPSTPGDPRELAMPASPPNETIAATVPIQPATLDPADERPLLPELASDVPRFDLDKALAQPLKEYRIASPVPAVDILYELRELSAIPIDWSAFPPAEDGPLMKPITVMLENTTVGAVLDAIAREMQAQLVRESQGIRFVPNASQ